MCILYALFAAFVRYSECTTAGLIVTVVLQIQDVEAISMTIGGLKNLIVNNKQMGCRLGFFLFRSFISAAKDQCNFNNFYTFIC